MKGWGLLGLGFLAQGLFSARFLIQLIKSEKEGKVLSPVIFWQLSLVASFLLMAYGTFRQDIVIVGGQVIGYFVYIRNLQLQNAWTRFPLPIRWFFLVLPPLFFLYLFLFQHVDLLRMLDNPEIDYVLLTWGSLGQLVFTARFLVQWYQAEKHKESYFPLSFWYISTLGAVMIASYAIFRADAVLFIGQGFGLLVYIRNIMIHFGPQNEIRLTYLERIKKYRVGLLLGLTAFVLFFNLNSWSVTESSEARYAQIGKEMLESGDWMHPQLMGIYHYHKPPMTYWITAVSYQIFGVSPFAARFFLQIAILLQIFLVYRIGMLLFKDTRKSFMAAMLYASFPVVIIGGRALTTDAYLATFILAALTFWFAYLQDKKSHQLILTYLFLGLGFLTKGPVVLIVPVVLWIYHLFQKSQKPAFNLTALFGLLLILTLGLGWFVALFIEDSQFLDYFVFKHTIQRFATDTFSRSQPFWFYPVILVGAAFPWFLVLLTKTKLFFRDKTNLISFFLAWVCLPVVFFSISQSKLILYILPVFSGLALGAISVWDQLSETSQKRWERAQLGFQILILVGLFLAPYIDERIVLSYKFLFLGVILICLLVGLILSGIRRPDRVIISAWMFTMGITAMSTYFFSQNPGVGNDTRRVVDWIEEHTEDTERIVIYDKRLPSVPFRTERPILSIYDGDEGLNRETQFQRDENWKDFLINLKSDPDWILKKKNQEGVWIAKSRKKMPDLQGYGNWEVMEEIDGWKILKIEAID
ncbi:lipid-A-disaccharide synthase N-terminal domain-containing protein [Algoriphagus sp. CAU 1675]|uniref:lipid-A-disaccharide synthase N-terminal domain-containing protein n=1 Tax=Algoriphagus sp. CAU 1675 TaxID=3032597 RepID=UPI0023DA6CD1|nr:lipid-A-disaccharide synthase N-terminal domain-containing protein [Algoriphagus sp. CAU 1675]MDF2158504.1 lipid-A-disaccharide synthase N-terminal domain-containing protein [Algoriphagus sp. CAU 1675]